MNTNLHEEINLHYGYSVAISSRNSPTSYPTHWHTQAEFILAKENNCIYSINETTYTLNEGDVLIVWPTELHEVLSTPERGSLIMQFDAKIISECRDFGIYYPRLQSIHKVSDYSEDLNRLIAQEMTLCEERNQNQESFFEAKALSSIYAMLINMCTFLQNNNGNEQSATPSFASESFLKIKSACNYIAKNCDGNLSQDEVAKSVGFSTYYFSRLFHQYTGETFSGFVTRQRIEMAKQLLGNKAIPVTDVAYLSGFQSISNFNKVFKSIMNCSPMQYRKYNV